MRIGKGNEKKGRMVSSPSMICARVWLGTVPFSQIREILFTFSGVLDPEELFEALNIHDGDNGLKEASALPSDSLAASRIERLDTTSMKIKPLPAPRRPKISAHRVGKTAKEAINPPQAQHATRSREPDSTSSLKLLKAFSQANPLSSAATKRASLAANHMKVNNKIRKDISGQNMSKKPCVGDSGTPSPEPTSSRFHIASRDLSGSVCVRLLQMINRQNL
ncbi:uncharacterized protein LOC111294187 isoform X2 [Durio zibethinus]|uniref:Uncharacterized protein LOC111294187 isoform X2 n=1 Tax=Durio zibethinus TaxID=66656 RepID=A0A6P5YSG0_DURZI|nr:uncharacterized protein LOC111294187 isoform X2 [Durio zibethinus]